MADIWDSAIARGMVLEAGQLLATTLAPFVGEALMAIHNTSGDLAAAIKRESDRDQTLSQSDITKWGLGKICDVINRHWTPRGGDRQRPCFQNYFKWTLKVQDVSGLLGDLRDVESLRNRAAHPEFQVPLDWDRFLHSSQAILSHLNRKEDADGIANYRSELSAIIAGGFQNRALLEKIYPPKYEEDFDNAQELWISGTNLRRILTDVKLTASVQHVLSKEDGQIKILMHGPDDDVCRYAMIQEGDNNLDTYREKLGNNLARFSGWRKQYEGKLKIKTIDYMLTSGLDVMNGSRNDASSALYVRMYPLPKAGIEKIEDQPIIHLRPKDGRWYDFFKQQFMDHWEHRLAKELSPDWAPKLNSDFQSHL